MDNHGHEQNNHTTSADFMVKRKRGRPRKHIKLDNDSNDRSPPGFSRTQHQRPSLNDEAMVGEEVTGMIEATFEDGFLLSVKTGDSDTMLRGVVFKHGHFHPVSADNDVAPHVPMITRNIDLAKGGQRSRRFRGGARALVPVPIQPKLPIIPNLTTTPVVQNGGSGQVPVRYGHGQVHNGSEEQALSIEPLQAIHPVHPVHMPSNGRGNMTELLQENVRETQFSQGQL
ncbi:AT hook motif-containing protein [Hirschfeldia incana]|nr:AT hook motif-containing protein [Hirschfeldia incana]